jgi:F1F0 ATPase subunit 2
MNEVMAWALALIAGALLGGIFFGGLWWTVLKGVSSRYAALWFAGSLLVRTAITLAGFYLVARASWQGLLFCLAGFVVARLVVTQLTREPVGSASQLPGGANHAS